MRDSLGRTIDYLRISVTDKCNLRCKYCMPPQGILPVAHEEILTLEEIFRLVSIMEQLGIRKVRLTGGEPMVRKNLPWLVEQIHGLPGIKEIERCLLHRPKCIAGRDLRRQTSAWTRWIRDASAISREVAVEAMQPVWRV